MTLVIVRGPSCSGKSSLCSLFRPATTISTDRIREELIGTAQIPPDTANIVWGEVFRRIKMRMKSKLFTIFDATNFSLKSIKKVHAIADSHGVDVHVVSLNTSFETCKERMSFRKAGVIDGVVVPHEKMIVQHEQYESKKAAIVNFFGDKFFEGSYNECEERINRLVYNHNRVVIPNNKAYVIGDVHGNLENLRRVASKIPADAVYFSVGDLIDRGDDSFGVMDFLMNDRRFGGFAMGNHESAFLNEMDDPINKCRSLARKITHSEFASFSETEKAKYLRFMYSGMSYIILDNNDTWEEALITHAGLGKFDPEQVSVFTSSSHRMNPVEEYTGAVVQVHGHMSWNYTGDFSGTVLNVDSGDGYGKIITAINPFTREVLTSE